MEATDCPDTLTLGVVLKRVKAEDDAVSRELVVRYEVQLGKKRLEAEGHQPFTAEVRFPHDAVEEMALTPDGAGKMVIRAVERDLAAALLCLVEQP